LGRILPQNMRLKNEKHSSLFCISVWDDISFIALTPGAPFRCSTLR
jgi:hypothetical protein